MKYLKKITCLLTMAMLCLSSLCGCGSKKVTVPFTEITWDNTMEDVFELEGESTNSYDSTYGGMTYVFDKEYNDLSGSIKYLFDENDKLVSMAWLYIPESEEDLENVYNELCKQTEKLYGESGFQSEQLGAKGQVWYLEDGNILIGVMSTGVNEAIQYQFFHPDVSSEKPQSEKNENVF